MRKTTFLLLIITGIIFFSIPFIKAESYSPPERVGCPSCLSFGVQRFAEKKEAPLFSLRDLEGNTITLNGRKGKPVLLMFWASWCPACKEDIVLLEKFLKGKKDRFEILTLAIDGEKEKRIKGVVKIHKITLPVLLDEKEKIARAYGVKMVPMIFLINQEGFIEGMIMGQRDWSLPEAWSAVKELFSLH